MELALMQALWVLGLLPDERLSEDVGIRALEAGMDTETLRTLASLASHETQDAKTLFEKVLVEFGLRPMSPQDAARTYAKAISRQILDGQLSPAAGANKLWEASLRVNDPDFHALDPFIYCASELNSRPEDATFFDREILREASEWIENPNKR